jgi:osmotically-inducible protein OsmY
MLAAILGCSEPEIKRIERVTGKAWDKARQASAQIGAELGLSEDDWKSTWNRLALPRLIEQRLRQDAALRGAEIRVQIEGDQIVLTGTVREETQRVRALEVIRSVDAQAKVRENLRIVGD